MDGHKTPDAPLVDLFHILSGQSAPLPIAVLRNVVLGLVLSLLLWPVQSILGRVHWQSVSGYLIVGNMMSFTGWLVEGVWYAHVAKMLKNPMGIAGYVTRVPFWYIAGGIGYVLGMLIAKRSGCMGFYDIPVNHLFTLGGLIGCFAQISIQVVAHRLDLKGSSVVR